MKTLRAAVIGLGRIGYGYHLPEVCKNDKFEACAVVDVSDERLAEAKEKFGVNGYRSLTEMLLHEKPDVVVIASPTHLHKDQTIEALEAGCCVFLDKPMAKNYDEVLEIKAAQEHTGGKIMVYQPHRAFSEANVLRKIISDGLIGKVYMYKRACTSYARRNDWQAFRKFGGGMLNNYGAHFVDQALYILGDGNHNEKVSLINCMRHKIASLGDADDVVRILLRTVNNTTVDIDINMACAHPVEPFMLLGEYGSVVLKKRETGNVFEVKYFDPNDLNKIELSDSLAAAGRKYSNDAPIPWKFKDYPISPINAVDFYNCCYDYFALDKKPFVTLDDTVELMRILEECRVISQRSFDESIGM